MEKKTYSNSFQTLEAIGRVLRLYSSRQRPLTVREIHEHLRRLESARRDRFPFYLLDVMMPGLNSMDAMLLSRPEFMRIHRSYIANMLQAERLSSTELRIFRGETRPVSRALRKEAASRWPDLHLEGGC